MPTFQEIYSELHKDIPGTVPVNSEGVPLLIYAPLCGWEGYSAGEFPSLHLIDESSALCLCRWFALQYLNIGREFSECLYEDDTNTSLSNPQLIGCILAMDGPDIENPGATKPVLFDRTQNIDENIADACRAVAKL